MHTFEAEKYKYGETLSSWKTSSIVHYYGLKATIINLEMHALFILLNWRKACAHV